MTDYIAIGFPEVSLRDSVHGMSYVDHCTMALAMGGWGFTSFSDARGNISARFSVGFMAVAWYGAL